MHRAARNPSGPTTGPHSPRRISLRPTARPSRRFQWHEPTFDGFAKLGVGLFELTTDRSVVGRQIGNPADDIFVQQAHFVSNVVVLRRHPADHVFVQQAHFLSEIVPLRGDSLGQSLNGFSESVNFGFNP